jgi:hypothetical protein
MAGFTYGLAVDADDEELRALLRRTPMPGAIALALHREPSFFVARQLGNRESQTVVCRDDETGELLGFGERSIRSAYVDGEPAPVGYLSMLRGAVERRGGLGLARGYRYFRSLHADERAPFYVTTIMEDNDYAVSVLASGRGGLPTYEPIGRLVTYLVPLSRRRRARVQSAERASATSLESAVERLNSWNRRHQLAPVYTRADLVGETSLLPGFDWSDLYVVRDGDRVVGTLGMWDQSAFKQTRVARYARQVAWVRPLYNAYAATRGVPGLPRPGAEVRTLYAAFLSAEGDSDEVAAALIERARGDWAGQGHAFLAIGVAEGHPLERTIARHGCRRLLSLVYAVYWPDAPTPSFDRSRRLHLEIATL